MSLRVWLEANAGKSARLGRRVVEGLREVGVLLIAFAHSSRHYADPTRSTMLDF